MDRAVGLMARDPDGLNSNEVIIECNNDIEIHEYELTDIQPNERTTMGRKRRRIILDGISQLNQHDKKMIQIGLGLTSNSNSG